MTHTFTRTALGMAGAMLAAGLFLTGGPAAAHTSLADSTPGAGDTVTELDRIRLEFTDGLLEVGTVVSVQFEDGEPQDVESEHVDAATVEADFPFSDAGAYVIVWRVVAEDGHPIEGEIDFTFAPEDTAPRPSPEPQPTAEAAPASPTPTELADPTPEPTTTPVDSVVDEGQGVDPLLALGIALIAALVVTVGWLLSRQREPADPDVS